MNSSSAADASSLIQILLFFVPVVGLVVDTVGTMKKRGCTNVKEARSGNAEGNMVGVVHTHVP